MSALGLKIIDTAVHDANAWINEVDYRTDWSNNTTGSCTSPKPSGNPEGADAISVNRSTPMSAANAVIQRRPPQPWTSANHSEASPRTTNTAVAVSPGGRTTASVDALINPPRAKTHAAARIFDRDATGRSQLGYSRLGHRAGDEILGPRAYDALLVTTGRLVHVAGVRQHQQVAQRDGRQNRGQRRSVQEHLACLPREHGEGLGLPGGLATPGTSSPASTAPVGAISGVTW